MENLDPKLYLYTEMPLEEFKNGVRSLDPQVRLFAAQSARKILCRGKSYSIDALINTGIVPILVSFLTHHDNVPLQLEACMALKVIASGNLTQKWNLVNCVAVPILASLLTSSHAYVAEQAVLALGYIAGGGPDLRNIVLRVNVIKPLIDLLKTNISVRFRSFISYALWNLCIGRNPPRPVIRQIIPAFAKLIQYPDVEVLIYALKGICEITYNSNEYIQEVIDCCALPRLCELLTAWNDSIVMAALNAVGNIAGGNDEQIQAVINGGALKSLKHLFLSRKSKIVQDASWIVANIMRGNTDQIQAVIDSGLITLIIDVLSKFDHKCRREAMWAVCNFTHGGSYDQMKFLLRAGVLPPLSNFLAKEREKKRNSDFLVAALEAIENILEVATAIESIDLDSMRRYFHHCGGVNNIKQLQLHSNSEVSKLGLRIFKKYFRKEEDVDEEEVDEGKQTSL